MNRYHFVFPSDPLKPRRPDEMFADQIEAFERAGFSTSVLSLESLEMGRRVVQPEIPDDAVVVYRGWMVRLDQYGDLVQACERGGARCLIDRSTYALAHHLPNWYPLIPELTPETRILSEEAGFESELAALGWDGYFVKDFVKSVKTSVGSRITDPSQLEAVLDELRRIRGEVEGGICVRRIEDLDPDTEVRYFVIRGRPFSMHGDVPQIVETVARRIDSPFFSVDVIRRADGELRVVEVGDGQVSDLVGWSTDALAAAWSKTNEEPEDAR